MGLYDDDLIPQLRKMVRAVQKHGARIGPELNFGGRVGRPGGQRFRVWHRRPCLTRVPLLSCHMR